MGWSDVCFKLKIADTVITGDKFYFENAGHNAGDWTYRINKYANSLPVQAYAYNYVYSRHNAVNQFYGSDVFENNMEQSGLRMIKQGEDTKDWNQDLLDGLGRLLDSE